MTNSEQFNIYNIIGKNIRKYRMLKGMTQRELADKMLLSESFIGKLESITFQTLSIDTLEQFARTLEVDITVFFDKSVIKKP